MPDITTSMPTLEILIWIAIGAVGGSFGGAVLALLLGVTKYNSKIEEAKSAFKDSKGIIIAHVNKLEAQIVDLRIENAVITDRLGMNITVAKKPSCESEPKKVE